MSRAAVALVLLAAAAGARGSEIELSYGHEALTRGQASWSSLVLEARLVGLSRPGASAGLSVRELERFEQRDRELGVSVRTPVLSRFALTGEATAGAEHRFLPVWSGALAVEWAGARGLGATAGVRWSRYDTALGVTDAALGRLGLERYFGAQRLAVTTYVATAGGGWTTSGRLAWDLFYGDGHRVGLGLAAGRELESVGTGLLVTPIVAATLTGRHAVGAGWAVTYELGVHRQGELYTRSGARVGLARGF